MTNRKFIAIACALGLAAMTPSSSEAMSPSDSMAPSGMDSQETTMMTEEKSGQ